MMGKKYIEIKEKEFRNYYFNIDIRTIRTKTTRRRNRVKRGTDLIREVFQRLAVD